VKHEFLIYTQLTCFFFPHLGHKQLGCSALQFWQCSIKCLLSFFNGAFLWNASKLSLCGTILKRGLLLPSVITEFSKRKSSDVCFLQRGQISLFNILWIHWAKRDRYFSNWIWRQKTCAHSSTMLNFFIHSMRRRAYNSESVRFVLWITYFQKEVLLSKFSFCSTHLLYFLTFICWSSGGTALHIRGQELSSNSHSGCKLGTILIHTMFASAHEVICIAPAHMQGAVEAYITSNMRDLSGNSKRYHFLSSWTR
jgi:hypothetical protein